MTGAFSTNCAVHIEDCEGCGGCMVVVAQWQSTGCISQVSWVQFLAFSLSIFTSSHLKDLFISSIRQESRHVCPVAIVSQIQPLTSAALVLQEMRKSGRGQSTQTYNQSTGALSRCLGEVGRKGSVEVVGDIAHFSSSREDVWLERDERRG